MSPRRLRLEGDDLDELITLARTRYGDDARIVSVERVTVGGLFGFLASRHFEVVVELPDPRAKRRDDESPAVLGLAALIESAELAEATVQDVTPSWRPSTSSADFAELMDALLFQTTGDPARGPSPRILNPGSFEPDSGDAPG